MGTVAQVLIGLIAFLHIYIMWFEMFAWEKRGPKVFRSFPKELFPQTTTLAANQGLYNGFLAAGLIWSLVISDVIWSQHVAIFFLGCVAVAGLYGFFTADKKIIFVQTIPSVIVILILLLG